LFLSVVAISTAPLWCSIIMIRHMVSNSLPDMVFSAAMCLAFIMPGMPEPPDWFMPDIDPHRTACRQGFHAPRTSVSRSWC
jgi:hypothetical protein